MSISVFRKPNDEPLALADRKFVNSDQGAMVTSRGCEASVNFGQCQRVAVLIVIEGGAPATSTPRWRMHGACEPCARALGLIGPSAA